MKEDEMARRLFFYLIILVGGGLASAPDAASGEEAARYRAGTSATFRLTTSPQTFLLWSGNAVTPTAKSPPTVLTCRFKILNNDHQILRVDLEITAPDMLPVNVTLNDLNLADLLTAPDAKRLSGIPAAEAVSYSPPVADASTALAPSASDTGAASAPWKVAATRITLTTAGEKISVIKSNEVPFGVAEIIYPPFHLQLLEYQW